MSNTDYNMHLGERLDVIVADKTYTSSIQEITPEGTLCIGAPVSRSVVIHLRAGDTVDIVYYRPQGMLTFTAGVLRDYEEKGIQLAEIEIKSTISRFQRREYVRLDISLALRLSMLAAPDEMRDMPAEQTLSLAYDQTSAAQKKRSDAPFEGVTADISGGGLRAFIPTPLQSGTLLECTLWLRNGDSFRSQAKVVRAGESGEGGKLPYTIGLQFVNVNEQARRKIIKYIFDEQIKIRKIEGSE